MIPHRDEILLPALSTDSTAKPRYNIRDASGNITDRNVTLELANSIAQEGTPINKHVLDEFLAASGTTAGTASAYTLAQEKFELFNGAPIRFQLHAASIGAATLNVNGTGAKPLRDTFGKGMPSGIPAGTWLTALYSASTSAYVIVGGANTEDIERTLYGERYTVDSAVAHVKDVPANVLDYAEIGEVGGMTYKVNVGTEASPAYELRSAEMAAVESTGVNLIPFPYKDGGAGTVIKTNGVTWTVNADGSVTANGNSTDWSYFMLHQGGKWTTEMIEAISVHVVSGGKSFVNCAYNPSNDLLYLYIAPNITVTNKTYHPMINRGIHTLPYTPYFHDILLIPEAVRALDGIPGGAYDCIYWGKDDKRNKRKSVGKVVLNGVEQWILYNGDVYTPLIDSTARTNSPCISDSVLTVEVLDENARLKVNTAGTHTVETWKAYLAEHPITIFYELATPIITDITDILPADNILGVQPGGTVTAVNDNNFAVPTEIVYENNVLGNRASKYEVDKLRKASQGGARADLSNASGTFGGIVKANAAAVANLGTAQVRNVTISATDLTAGSSALATGDSYHVYS